MTRVATVAKFGGSTFHAPEDYRRIARHLLDRVHDAGAPAVAVVSAMPGETEDLRSRIQAVHDKPSYRGSAGLLTLADTISAYLLHEAVIASGGRAVVLGQHAHGIVTDRSWMAARILRLDERPLREAAEHNDVVVVPGGPAADGGGVPTWMGKNSSDLAATAVAAALGATECEVYSDVSGIYDADPNVVPEASVLPTLSFGTASVLALHGAKVLHHRAIRLARENGITIRCRWNTEPFTSGTVIGAHGVPVQAVVADLHSTVLEFTDVDTMSAARTVLGDHDIHAVQPDGSAQARLGVPGGFVDVERILAESGIDDVTRHPGRMVTEISGSRQTHHIVRGDSEAVALARRLHSRLCGAGSAPSPAAS